MTPDLLVRCLVGTFSFFTGCATPGTHTDSTRAARIEARAATPFVREQLRYDRVREAREKAEVAVAEMFHRRHIDYPSAEVLFRVFKRERSLELWARPVGGRRFELVNTYPICALAGVLGPKKKQGDGQVPEGFYFIDLFNPNSSYHLSMRINYPNQRDRLVGKTRDLGGQIFIHGGCRSDGCLAITDEAIEELYWIAVMARGNGQERIPVHIFPTRFEKARQLNRVYLQGTGVPEFWESLKAPYEYFQRTHELPDVDVGNDGLYRLATAD